MEKLKRKRKNPLSYARPPLKCPCNPSEDPKATQILAILCVLYGPRKCKFSRSWS